MTPLPDRPEILCNDEEFVLSRDASTAGPPRLVVAPSLGRPARSTLEKLEHAYGLRDELDSAWAARPLEFVAATGRLTIEDPGGSLLARHLGSPWETGAFLRVAVGLAAALRGLHQRDLVHRDLKPAHVFADLATGRVWLSGFGLASRVRHQRQAPPPPHVIAGTLAYMAPEQTGRMNRSIDSRSDLYACGVMLYELLTGSLPFTASDPLEWIHCHVARQPAPPDERVKGIPGLVAAIVLKLLAKNPEDRYQTATGLEADLRRCLEEWESRGAIEPFPLGAQDVLDRLLIPERLYGRERAVGTLLAAFEQVVAGRAPALVLVSGYSGIGKSAVVNELHKALVPPRGLFASAKFEQYQRDTPYGTLARALRGLIQYVLAQGEADLDRWRGATREALGPHGQLMVDLIPELELILGKQPPVPALPPREAQLRFQMVLRRFVAAFASPEHPLVLFLDDLQWLDGATRDLLPHLVSDPEVGPLLLVGAYRENEVGPSHPLRRTVDAIRATRAPVREIRLDPLGLDDVGRLVADALSCDRGRSLSLAQLVHERTGGNPFFVIQFLTILGDEGLVAFDPTTTTWTWNLERIRSKGYTDNVVEFLIRKLARLPSTTLDALRHLACLGNTVRTADLAIVLEVSGADAEDLLQEAVRAGLILRVESGYAFLHDRVQKRPTHSFRRVSEPRCTCGSAGISRRGPRRLSASMPPSRS